MALEKFTVIEPPTSGEVETQAINTLLQESGVLTLVILATEQEVPRPQPQDLQFKVRKTGHPDDGGMVIEGKDSQRRHVNVETAQDPQQPATAYIISA